MLRFLKILEPCLLLVVPLILGLCAFFKVENAALLTALVALVAALPFFLRFEMQRPKPRDIMPVVVLSAFAAAGRIIFAAFPNFKPVSAIVIVSAISFGKQAGFLVGALAALASNMFFGQGPWTPWQMYAWGLIGYIAGVLHEAGVFRKPLFVYIYGFVSALLYGGILDSWNVVGYVYPFSWPAALVVYGAGLPFSLIHAVATVVFLLPIYAPWSRKFERIKRKFGIKGSREAGNDALESPH